jgi:multimeric flavodoxin WrbA
MRSTVINSDIIPVFMHVLIVCGSADPEGTTASMCQVAEDAVRECGSVPEIVFPGGMRIGHCTGCEGCRGGECVIDDDMRAVSEAFERSDLVILASPIHFSGPSSLIKTVMDRFQFYWCSGRIHGGRIAAMLCGGSPEPRFHCAVYIMRAFSITLGMEWCGHLEASHTDGKGFVLPEDEIRMFVKDLLRSSRERCCPRTPRPGSRSFP